MTKTPFVTAALSAVIALIVGTAGGAVFQYLHAPLPWTLGSLFFTAIMALCGGTWFLPRVAWSVARPLVGVLAGSAFTLAVLMSIPGWWDVIAALIVYSAIITILGWLFFSRVCKYDDITSLFASAPGGLGELTLLGGTLGGSVRTLVFIHSVRVVLTVFVVPFILQWYLLPPGTILGGISSHEASLSALDWLILGGCGVIGFFIGRPFPSLGGAMLAPMALSAAAHIGGLTEATPPGWLVAFMQVLIGCIAGSRFAGTTWPELRTTAVYATVWALFVLAAAMFAAWLCTFFADEPLLALILAFTPGGIVEITVIAYALGLHVAFIITLQLCRVTLALMLTPALFKLMPNPRLPGESPGDGAPDRRPPDA